MGLSHSPPSSSHRVSHSPSDQPAPAPSQTPAVSQVPVASQDPTAPKPDPGVCEGAGAGAAAGACANKGTASASTATEDKVEKVGMVGLPSVHIHTGGHGSA